MSRRFTIPVVLTCSAHAVLLFGFKSPSSPLDARPVAPAPVADKCILPVTIDELKVLDPVAAVSDARTAKPLIPRPASLEPRPSEVSEELLGIAGRWDETIPIKVPIKVIPGGPISPYGDPNSRDTGSPNGGLGLVYNPLSLDDAPRARVQAPPSYPFSLKASGISGEVLVEFVVDEEGRVLSPKVVRSTHPDFNTSTLTAVSRWRFEPGTRHNKPVRFRMAVPVKFNLNNTD